MTDSRETMRRRAFRDQAPAPDPMPVPLTDLCIIHGCLCRRAGANLCPSHDKPNLPRTQRCH